MAARYLEITRSGSPTSDHAAVVQPQNAVADRLHVADGVRDKQNRDAALPQFVHLAHAALAEINVAYRQSLIHQQNFGIHVDGHRKGQAHHHAARVGLDRLIDEVADFGESRDIFVALVDLARGEPQNRAVQVDVVPAAEFGVKSSAQFQQRRDAPVDIDRAGGGVQNPRDHLQERALAGAILPDDAERLAALHLKTDIVKRPEILVALQTVQRQQFLEAVARRVVDRVTFRNTLKFNGVHGWEIERLVYRGAGDEGRITEEQKRRGRPPTPRTHSLRIGWTGGKITAAPVPTNSTRRVRIRSGSDEEAGSRPFDELVLSTSSLSYRFLPFGGSRPAADIQVCQSQYAPPVDRSQGAIHCRNRAG